MIAEWNLEAEGDHLDARNGGAQAGEGGRGYLGEEEPEYGLGLAHAATLAMSSA
jgi:hypothetical protein